MKKICLLLLGFSGLVYAKETNIPLNSVTGGQELAQSISSGNAQSFLAEVQYMTYQHNLFNCGPTSLAIALNSLHVPAPQAESLGNYAMFTYKNIFTPQLFAQTGISYDTVFKQPGLSLAQLGQVLNVYPGVTATTYFANAVSEKKAKDLIIKALHSGQSMVLVNVLRPALGQPGGGHTSPLGAYNPATDSVLFMDVASFKPWGPTWIPFSKLYAAMNTMDGKHSRGFVIVSYTKPKVAKTNNK